MSRAIRVVSSGPQATVQDLGRFGVQSLGVPVSGALDRTALRLANALVGNAEGAAAIEIRLGGFVFRAEGGPVRFAVAGAAARIEAPGAEPRATPAWRSAEAPEGATVFVAAPAEGIATTLALAGGVDAPPLWGSRSTYLRGGFGGHEGRALRAGDRLSLGPAPDAPALSLRRPPRALSETTLRVALGPQDDLFTVEAVEAFLGGRYVVTRDADRMGLRLDGPALAHARGSDIVSDAVLPGSIQVPGSGQPIILLADCQTTGGYPKIATVVSADLPLAGRLGPGAVLRFRAIAVEEAEEAARDAERALRAAIAGLAPPEERAAIDEDALRRCNLISGVVGDME